MEPFSLNIRGRLHSYDKPRVMGIINATPDSYYEQSRACDAATAAARAAEMISAGATIIDVGACSTRPGSEQATAEDEIARLDAVLPVVKAIAGDKVLVSVDTYRAKVARHAVEKLGADIINDVAGCSLDADMADTVAELGVPYIMGHMRGTVSDMMEYAEYRDVTAEVLSELGDRLSRLALMGVNDVIVDPGFGFSKTTEQNFELLAHLDVLQLLHRPIMVGMSRKSMITKTLGITADEALNATTALNVMAMDRGAAILRVHDVKAAVEAVSMYTAVADAKRGPA